MDFEPCDDVADRIGGRSERPPTAVVLGRHDANLERADGERLAHLDLENALELPLAKETAEPAGQHDRELLPEPFERRQVEMVVVRMGDEHRIDAAQRPGRDGRRAPEMRDAIPQQRVGQEANAVEIDEDRGVADVLNSPAQDRNSASAELPVAQDPRRRPLRGR